MQNTNRIICTGRLYPLIEIHGHEHGLQFYFDSIRVPRFMFDLVKALGPDYALQDDDPGRLHGRVISLIHHTKKPVSTQQKEVLTCHI